jgi:predicted GNAT family N-acyltransferase
MFACVHAEQIRYRWASGPQDFADALAIRVHVFCDEQGVPRDEEPDLHDAHALHLLALATGGERAVGTLRLLIDGRGARIGRVAVEADARRRGIASRMLALALERAQQLGVTNVRLAAQVVAVSLYQQAGFAVESQPFEEAGIAHVWMGRRLERTLTG